MGGLKEYREEGEEECVQSSRGRADQRYAAPSSASSSL